MTAEGMGEGWGDRGKTRPGARAGGWVSRAARGGSARRLPFHVSTAVCACYSAFALESVVDLVQVVMKNSNVRCCVESVLCY